MKIKKLLSALLVCVMVLGTMSAVAFADETTMTFADFIQTVTGANGEFDGKGVTVEWSPVSGCFQTGREHICTADEVSATAETPNRENAKLAQYQIFNGLEDIHISNVNFKYVAKDFTVCANSGWSGRKTAEEAPTAQIHMYNKGNVTLEGCTFDNVVATPWNYADNHVSSSDRTVTVEGCTFKNIPVSYGLKDVQAATVTIANNNFDNTRSGIMLSGATAKNVKISGNTFNCDSENDLIQIASNFEFDNDSDMTVSENTSTTDAGVFRMENKAVKNVKVINNNIPASASYTSKNSKYTAEVSEDGSVTSYGWDGAEGTTVEYKGNYYKTLAEAVKAVYIANDDTAVLNCKKDAEVGQLSHAHVSNSITINGNGAKVEPGGDQDLEVDTYYYNRSSGKQVEPANDTAATTLDRDISITINNLSGIAVWGQRHSDYTVNVVLNDCKNLNRVYISGATGKNNYKLTNCTFDSAQRSHRGTSVYSNNAGTIEINNCSFKGIALACNFNNKSNGQQNITINNCQIVDCATGDTISDDEWKKFTAPIRFVTSGTGAKSDVNVNNTSISYTEGKENIGNGDILLGEGRKGEKSLAGVTLKTEGVDADVQIQYPGSPSKTEKITVKADAPSTIEIPAVAAIGEAKYSDLASAVAAAQNGDTIKIIGKVAVKDGDLPADPNYKTLTFAGEGSDAELTFVDSSDWEGYNRYYANGSNLTFKNLILTWKDSVNYQGICHTKNVVYEDCTINGVLHLYGETETFTRCHFVQKAVEYNVWTYGAGVATFNECTFDSQGKSVLVYREQGPEKKVVINNSTFNAEKPAPGKAAVEISGNLASNVEINGSTANGFGGGSVSDSSLWNVKDGSASNITLSVDGTIINLGTVNIAFIKADLDSENNDNNDYADVYDIYVTSLDSINKLNSTDLTFAFDGAGAAYEVEGAENITLTPKDDNRYMFSYKDGTKRNSGTKIKIGTVTVTGSGEYEFKVVPSATNTVNATTAENNIVEYFDGSGETGKGVLNIENATTGRQELKIASKELTIEISFPNAVTGNDEAYQQMSVSIKGGTYDETFNLGATDENGGYKLVEELPANISYTVTVSGAGYRTARHTVTMTGDKTLKFWNNVLDTAAAVEEGKTPVTKNFLAGDIVKDNKINIYDLSAVVSYYGRTNDTASADAYAKYDLNRDGVIDSKDVAMVLVSWGN